MTASSLAPAFPASARPEPWTSPSYCSACHRNHPGHCGCPCHQVSGRTGTARDRRLPAPACFGPDHPGAVLVPLPGGGARGTCPVDGAPTR
jgi:hypothetical protein